jgi:GH15 family glucan-1,4-alpha-glucosidase
MVRDVIHSGWRMTGTGSMVRPKTNGATRQTNVVRLRGRTALLAEEVDPATRELLGNFPQAFSHIGPVNAA